MKYDEFKLSKSKKNKPDSGFTVIEIIVVLIVMGIIAAFAIGRGLRDMPNLSIRTEIIKSHLRHAQVRAMNSNAFWGIRTDGNSYEMFRCASPTCNSTDIVRLPGEKVDTVNLATAGISLTTGTYSFDDRGVPYYNTDHEEKPSSSDLLGSDKPVAVTKGADNISFTIIKRTGFIR